MPKAPRMLLLTSLMTAALDAMGQGIVPVAGTSSNAAPIPVLGLPTDLTADQRAVSDSLMQYLASRPGGLDAVFVSLRGKPKLPTESLTVVVPVDAILLGDLHYGKEVQLKVKAALNGIENCNQPNPVEKTVSVTTTVTRGATWSTTKSSESTQTHAVSVSSKVNVLGAADISASYGFTDSLKSGLSQTETGSQQVTTTTTDSTPLTANKNRSEFFRGEVVQLVGRNAPFRATARVTSKRPLEFYIAYAGYTPTLTKAPQGTQLIYALQNVPAAASGAPAADVNLGHRALISPSGAFGYYPQVDSVRKLPISAFAHADFSRGTVQADYKQATNVFNQTDWAYMQCRSVDLILRKDGNAVWTCDGKVQSQTGTSIARGNPCYYMTFRMVNNKDVGNLACYSRDVSGLAAELADQYLVWGAKNSINKDGPRPSTSAKYQLVTKTLNEVTGEDGHSFLYTGIFDGELTVMGPFYCGYGFDLTPLPDNPQRCKPAQQASTDQMCQSTATALQAYRTNATTDVSIVNH